MSITQRYVGLQQGSLPFFLAVINPHHFVSSETF